MASATISEADSKQADLVARIADLLLSGGVAQIPLRDLAAQLGTSDRMLLYYFGDKANLVLLSLQAVSVRLARLLEAVIPSGKHKPDTLLRSLLLLFKSPPLAPPMQVWADVSARAGWGEEPFRSIARRSVAEWLAWLEQRLDIDEASQRHDTAVALLAVVEGARQIENSIPGSTDRVAETLSRAFQPAG